MHAFPRIQKAFEYGLANIGAGACLFLMMVVTVLSVFGRYVLEVDLIGGAFNMVERIFFPLMVFWAMPLAYREGAFPRLAVIVDGLPARRRALAAVLVTLVELMIFAALVYYTGRFALDGIRTGLTAPIGTNHWPIYPVLAMVPLCFALMALEMVRLILADLRKVLGEAASDSDSEVSHDLLD